MASWYAEQRHAQTRKTQQRRRRAWAALLLSVFAYMALWGGRNLLG